jgi:ABC-type cobalamin transport system permease subunit
MRTHSAKDLVISLVGIVCIATFTVYLLFGSLLANPTMFGVENGGIVPMLMREAIMDYDCAGSNVWVYLCLHIIPSMIVFVKILTD